MIGARRCRIPTPLSDEPSTVDGPKGRTGMTHPLRLSVKEFWTGFRAQCKATRYCALPPAPNGMRSEFARGEGIWKRDRNDRHWAPAIDRATFSQPINTMPRSQAALRRDARPRGRFASSMPKNLRRPVRINIMSAARSQPDRIGPLCPIPNQSSPRSVTTSAAASQL